MVPLYPNTIFVHFKILNKITEYNKNKCLIIIIYNLFLICIDYVVFFVSNKSVVPFYFGSHKITYVSHGYGM